MCGIIVIGVHAIVEDKRSASFLQKLILVVASLSRGFKTDQQVV